jgi:RHS repeat-associated protein
MSDRTANPSSFQEQERCRATGLVGLSGVLQLPSIKRAGIHAPKDEMGYTGCKFGTDLGLSYMQARYYDPMTGLFMGNNPVGYVTRNPHSFGRYTYVSNNPYKYRDPDGKYGVFGFVLGVGLEVARQALTGQLTGDLKSLGKIAVAGAAGAIGATSTAANNAIDGKPLTDGMSKGAALGVAGAAVGTAAGDLVDAAVSVAKGSTSLATKQMVSHVNSTTGDTLGNGAGVAECAGTNNC